jgi:hypothetical protein
MDAFQRFYGNKMFRRGFWLFVVGSGPLILVIVAAALGLTRDPNPNPVGLGILAMLTFWPSVILMIIGAVRAKRATD